MPQIRTLHFPRIFAKQFPHYIQVAYLPYIQVLQCEQKKRPKIAREEGEMIIGIEGEEGGCGEGF